jgi:hypothetical protein
MDVPAAVPNARCAQALSTKSGARVDVIFAAEAMVAVAGDVTFHERTPTWQEI